jgi:hypothetical protein
MEGTVSARDALAAIRERAQAATEGPWWGGGSNRRRDAVGLVGRLSDRGTGNAIAVLAGVGMDRVADAEFIAHARTDVPALVEALEAVLAIHEEKPYGAAMTRVAPHVPDYVCSECTTPEGGCVPYPCSTVHAIETALEGR